MLAACIIYNTCLLFTIRVHHHKHTYILLCVVSVLVWLCIFTSFLAPRVCSAPFPQSYLPTLGCAAPVAGLCSGRILARPCYFVIRRGTTHTLSQSVLLVPSALCTHVLVVSRLQFCFKISKKEKDTKPRGAPTPHAPDHPLCASVGSTAQPLVEVERRSCV